MQNLSGILAIPSLPAVFVLVEYFDNLTETHVAKVVSKVNFIDNFTTLNDF